MTGCSSQWYISGQWSKHCDCFKCHSGVLPAVLWCWALTTSTDLHCQALMRVHFSCRLQAPKTSSKKRSRHVYDNGSLSFRVKIVVPGFHQCDLGCWMACPCWLPPSSSQSQILKARLPSLCMWQQMHQIKYLVRSSGLQGTCFAGEF